MSEGKALDFALQTALAKLPEGLDQPALRYFLDYVRYDTQADYASPTCPSTAGQMVLAKRLVQDLSELGIEADLDENGYVMATLEATQGLEEGLTLGLIAHMDTALDLTGANVNPQLCYYDGEALTLDTAGQYRMDETLFPNLKKLRGQHLICTDGQTLLGADNKAGLAAIMGLLHYYVTHPEVPRGRLRIAFTPDEEIGRGPHRFDVKKFGADLAYTIDGGELGELECESFNAARALLTFRGLSVHPGSAKDQMINAILLANEWLSALPKDEIPAKTEGYEGFFHVHKLEGGVEEVKVDCILRDFTREGLARRKHIVEEAVQAIRAQYGDWVVELDLKDEYANMKEVIDRYPVLMDFARQAMLAHDVTPIEHPIRGGTDGSQLSFMGLPCPNLFTGGDNFHGRYEYLCVESFKTLHEVLKTLCGLYAGKRKADLGL